MPCNGWNHSASCDCGWGGRWYGNLPSERTFVCTSKWVDSQPGRPLATSIERLLAPGTPRRFTNPNAHCPVCGASVFYFQNEFGSRVFFDDLGVPWPKHPCTDNDIYRYSRSARILACESTTPTRRSNVRGYHWRSLAIWRKLNGFVVLYDSETNEYFKLDIDPGKFSNVFPIISAKILSEETMALSYFHMGVRSSLTIGEVTFKKVIPRLVSPVAK
jgi:hypothetical protein